MNLQLQSPQAKSLPPCLSPYSSWWYQPCALLWWSLPSCGDAGALLHFSALDLLVLQPSRARGESSRACGCTGGGEQLPCMYQMFSMCLHVPLQDFLGEKFHCALGSICMFPHRSLGLVAISAHTFGCCLLSYVELLLVELMCTCTGGWISGHSIDSVAQSCLSAIWKNTSEFVWTSFPGRDIWENLINPCLNQKVGAASPFSSYAQSC